MIDWACDSNVLVSFDKEPILQVRIITPSMTSDEKIDINKKPFIIINSVRVLIFDNKKFKHYEFEIYKNYTFDGASVPRFFWRIIGAKTDNEFLIASLIHDVLCENHEYIDNDRKLSSNTFRVLLIASGVNNFKANVMYLAVDLYQKFFIERRKKWIKN